MIFIASPLATSKSELCSLLPHVVFCCSGVDGAVVYDRLGRDIVNAFIICRGLKRSLLISGDKEPKLSKQLFSEEASVVGSEAQERASEIRVVSSIAIVAAAEFFILSVHF